MKILMILNAPFPPDIRVEKEIAVLKEKGHHVVLVVDEQAQTGEPPRDIDLVRVPVLNRGITRRILFRFSSRDPLLVEHTKRRLETLYPGFLPDVVHVHDLLWARFGQSLATLFNAKLVLDFHENFPAFIECKSYQYPGAEPLNFNRFVSNIVFHNLSRWRAYERKMVKQADRVIVVVPEAQNRFRDDPTLEDKFVVVSNTEDPSAWDATKKRDDSHFVISYVGGGAIHRGIDTLVRSIDYVDNPKIKIVIVGLRGNTPFDRYIKKIAEGLRHRDQVELLGWVPSTEVERFIGESDLCAVPHANFEHTQTTVPHKLFQYMAMSKPVLVSDVAPLKRIVQDAHSGLIFEADNPKSCADQILFAVANRKELEKFGDNGYQMVQGKYHFKHDARRLCDLYDSLGEPKLDIQNR